MYNEIKEFIGLTFISVINYDSTVKFETADGIEYVMMHHQDCCESVYLEDVCGDLNDLIGSPILQASEDSSGGDKPLTEAEIGPSVTWKTLAAPLPLSDEYDYDDSHTWTFYKLGTIKGSVTLRWYGSSNGYYGESISIDKNDWKQRNGITA